MKMKMKIKLKCENSFTVSCIVIRNVCIRVTMKRARVDDWREIMHNHPTIKCLENVRR